MTQAKAFKGSHKRNVSSSTQNKTQSKSKRLKRKIEDIAVGVGEEIDYKILKPRVIPKMKNSEMENKVPFRTKIFFLSTTPLS